MNVLFVSRRKSRNSSGSMDRQSLNEIPLVNDGGDGCGAADANDNADIGGCMLATHILTTCRLQLEQLEQLPRTRVTVVDLAALPVHHQAALVHASHVMASIQ